MQTSKKLLGVSVDAQTTERHYASYKVDYDSQDDLQTLLLEDSTEVEPVDTQTLSDYLDAGRIDDRTTTVTNSDGTTSEDRFALVEDGVTRDALKTELDALSISYQVSDVSVSQKERLIIEREGARNQNEIEDTLQNKATLLDRDLIEDSSRKPIAKAIKQLESTDAELASALGEVYHIMTGETPQETLDRLAQ
jgi:transcriptional regulator of NAD metabolism